MQNKIQFKMVLRFMILTIILIIHLLIYSCERCSCPNQPDCNLSYKVKKVIDGDTIDLENGDRVRYIGIDTPEEDSCYYQEALDFNKTLVDSQTVRLELDEELIDAFGRLLAYVYVDTLFVNAELVRQGFAKDTLYPPNDRYANLFAELEEQAKEANMGLWGECD